jgi:hypothetical protein
MSLPQAPARTYAQVRRGDIDVCASRAAAIVPQVTSEAAAVLVQLVIWVPPSKLPVRIRTDIGNSDECWIKEQYACGPP